MRSKPHPIMSSYGLCIVMLVALLTHANAISADNSLTMTSSNPTISQPAAFNSSLDDTRAEHRLRTDTETMANDGDDNFEERLLEGIGLGTPRIRTALETAMLKLKQFINKAMTKFGLTKQSKVDKFFEQLVQKSASSADEIPKVGSPDFQKLSLFASNTYTYDVYGTEKAIVTTLAKHYGEVSLLTMLSAAEKDLSTRYTATKLLKAQLYRWRSSGKSCDEFFKLLKLDKVKRDELLHNPMMHMWIRYVLTYGTPQMKAKTTWPLLLKLYTDEETITAVLAKALVFKENKDVRGAADGIMELRLEYWFTEEKKSVEEAFKLLKLDKAGDKILQNPMLEYWVSYVRRFTDETQPKLAVASTDKHYKDEVALLKKLTAALRE